MNNLKYSANNPTNNAHACSAGRLFYAVGLYTIQFQVHGYDAKLDWRN